MTNFDAGAWADFHVEQEGSARRGGLTAHLFNPYVSLYVHPVLPDDFLIRFAPPCCRVPLDSIVPDVCEKCRAERYSKHCEVLWDRHSEALQSGLAAYLATRCDSPLEAELYVESLMGEVLYAVRALELYAHGLSPNVSESYHRVRTGDLGTLLTTRPTWPVRLSPEVE